MWIASHHGVIESFQRWRERLHAWMVNHNIAHKLVTVSERTHQIALLEGVKAESISVIQNGIQPMPFEGEHRLVVRKESAIGVDELFLHSVGRLVYQKGHNVLVYAMHWY